MSIQRRPSKFERIAILSPIRAYIKHKYNIKIIKNETIGLKPPYIILSNHVNNWDPLFINCFVDEPLCFVAAAPLFRNKTLKKVLDYTGAISKTKEKNDMGTIRKMLLAKKHNRAIALFPEGNRNWDGHSDELIFATAKLVKLLNIPVVIATIKGGYLSNPRWADSIRKGEVHISLEKKWDTNELSHHTVEEIHQLLSQQLNFDEIGWNEIQCIQFTGKGLAEYLERFLFTCPHCLSISSMHSEDDVFSCKHCAYKVKYTPYGTLEPLQKELKFKYLKDWNDWQLTYIEQEIKENRFNYVLQKDLIDTVELAISYDDKPYTIYGDAQIQWIDHSLSIKTKDNQINLIIPFRELEGLNVHMHNKLDFFHGNQLVRCTFSNPRTSAYKWRKIIQMHQAIKEVSDA